MSTLAHIEHEISNILAVADELEDDMQPTALEYLDSLALMESEKIDAISYAVRKRKNHIEWLMSEERRLRQLRLSMERRLEAFRVYLSKLLEAYGIKSIKGRAGSVGLRTSQSVEVIDVDNLPMEFKEVIIEQKPKKTKLREALLEGHRVDGARLVPQTVITIR